MTSHRLDAVALVLNHLILIGRAAPDADPSEVEVSIPSMRTLVPILATLRFESTERKPQRDTIVRATGYIIVCPLDFEFAKHVSAHSIVSIGLLSNRRVVGSGTHAVLSLRSPEILVHEDNLRLMSIESAAGNPVFFGILASILDSKHKSPTIATHLDHHLIVPGSAFFASGWVDGVGEHSVAFVLDEFRLVVNPNHVLTKPGDAVADGSRLNRFTCIDTLVGECNELRLAAVSGSSVRWSQVLDLRSQGGPRAFLQAVSRDLTYQESLYLASSTNLLQQLAEARSEPQAADVRAEDHDQGATPDLSIIIPFYGDASFLLDHLESQRRTDVRAEWIFVCDDPALLPSMLDEWRGRGTGGKTSRLISLSENAGYAKANNIAFRRARADIVVLMNSDIYWSSLAPLEYGAKLLRDNENIGVVGFTLRYEDGSVQHAGMSLSPVTDHDDLLHWVHPGKGLPAKDMGDAMSTRDVEAVTGALMLVRRRDFDGALFDERYVGGDYEDGDLCLAVRAQGKRITLVECDGLFHLERHSIRSSAHGLFTAMNCVRFNRKWTLSGAPRLSDHFSDIDPGPRLVVRSPRSATTKSIGTPIPEVGTSDCAIHAHIFYPNLVDEVLTYLTAEHLSGFDTYVTVVDGESLTKVKDALESVRRSNIRVTLIQNGGRDLAPLFVHSQDLFRRYKFICHLHTKKSPHTDFGDEWRRYLFSGCVGSAATVASILSRFKADPELGVAFPNTFPKILPFTQVELNVNHIDALLKRLNTKWKYKRVEFPVGSMCWLRTEAFLPVLGKIAKSGEIEAETGQIDNTWAHAMERCLTLIPELNGFTSWSYPVKGHPQ